MELHGGNGMMLDFGIEKLYRDAAMFLHMDATVDISKFKIVKTLFPDTAGKYAGPEKSNKASERRSVKITFLIENPKNTPSVLLKS